MTERVVTVTSFAGLCGMIVCCSAGVQDKEILHHCNDTNPSGTSGGWSEVVRSTEDKTAPLQCSDSSKRTHYVVMC